MYKELLDSLVEPIVMADTEHVMVYMNKAAEKQFKKWGGKKLLGKSVFDCHNDNSCKVIKEVFAKMLDGLDEELIGDTDKQLIFMRAVRDETGQVIGYYERYENKQQK